VFTYFKRPGRRAEVRFHARLLDLVASPIDLPDHFGERPDPLVLGDEQANQ
jgi:hypothetical protein